MPPISDAQREALAKRFVHFADQECGDYAAVHSLLLGGADHALGAFYPSVTSSAVGTTVRCAARKMVEPSLENS